jgi:hypothetical protein
MKTSCHHEVCKVDIPPFARLQVLIRPVLTQLLTDTSQRVGAGPCARVESKISRLQGRTQPSGIYLSEHPLTIS